MADTWLGYLQSDPNDTWWEARMKNTLEGAGIGAFADVLMTGLRLSKNYIRGNIYEKLIKQKGEVAENSIATFNFLNSVYPGYMKDNWANVLKRLKIPFTPTVRNREMSDSKALYIKEKNINIIYLL